MQNTLHAAHPLIPPLICLGKAQELRAELLSEKTIAKTSKQRAILKRIIANMSMGNDMSSLFPDVLACANSGNLEIKKLVCLYLVNYAKNRQEFTEQALANFARVCMHTQFTCA
jgi:vesicle coat complex subunit